MGTKSELTNDAYVLLIYCSNLLDGREISSLIKLEYKFSIIWLTLHIVRVFCCFDTTFVLMLGVTIDHILLSWI